MKILIIRFSSFGDIIQCTAAAAALKRRYPKSEIHWVVRADLASLIGGQPGLTRVWAFSRAAGLKGLWALARILAKESYTHIYDAHNNLRSHLLLFMIKILRMNWGGWSAIRLARRSKQRLRRLLLFGLRINLFNPVSFIGARTYLTPLVSWQISMEIPTAPIYFPSPLPVDRFGLPQSYGVLAASAAWKLKRWPIAHWRDLICHCDKIHFVLLGGSEDHFCEELRQIAPHRVSNLAGKLSLEQSLAVLSQSQFVVSADTGLCHAADAMGKPLLALIGPTAFGYPAQASSEVLETQLWCRPCSKDGRGRCRNREYQKCMTELRPEQVLAWIERRLARSPTQ